MKKITKVLLLVSIFSLCLGIYANNVEASSTGVVSYSGDLGQYLTSQKTSVNDSFDTTYNKLYTEFTKTGLAILKSVEYQSLVCLGAIKEQSFLAQIQQEKTSFKSSFSKDIAELENQIAALEEKNRILITNNVNLFGTSNYETEKAKLKEQIDIKIKNYQTFITNFETSYFVKSREFFSSFDAYSQANKELVKSISERVNKVQKVVTAFDELEVLIKRFHDKVTGLDDLLATMEASKTKGMTNLDKAIQPFIDINVKKYKKLQTLSNELVKQKMFVVGQYQLDIDEYVNTTLKTRYDRSMYNTVKSEVTALKSKFYTPTNQLNCSSILTTVDDTTVVLQKITSLREKITSGFNYLSIPNDFKIQLLSGFQTLYVQKFNQRLAEYKNYLKEYIKTALRNFVSSLVPITPVVTPTQPTILPVQTGFVFTKPFKSGEYHLDIKELQKLFTNIGLYSGAIDGVYTKATKTAVHQFQLSKGLLKGYENKPETWGWMGPATRAALNALIK